MVRTRAVWEVWEVLDMGCVWVAYPCVCVVFMGGVRRLRVESAGGVCERCGVFV